MPRRHLIIMHLGESRDRLGDLLWPMLYNTLNETRFANVNVKGRMSHVGGSISDKEPRRDLFQFKRRSLYERPRPCRYRTSLSQSYHR